MTYVTYEELIRDCRKIAVKIPPIKCVRAIPRSGLIAASVLSCELHVPVGVCRSKSLWVGSRTKNTNRVSGNMSLVVDDSAATCKTMKKATRDMTDFYRCAIYPNSNAIKEFPDMIHARVIPGPRIFEWHLFNSHWTGKALFDLDGVFCVDPTREHCASDEAHRKYCLIAEPLTIPGRPLKGIVTGRMESSRKETSQWLNRHGIECETLKMRSGPEDIASYKAREYAKSDALLFVESSERQSVKIAKLTGKPVISIETNRLIII